MGFAVCWPAVMSRAFFAQMRGLQLCDSRATVLTIDQKETPAKGRGSEISAGVCPCFHPVSFSPHSNNLATSVSLCQLLFDQSLERHSSRRFVLSLSLLEMACSCSILAH